MSAVGDVNVLDCVSCSVSVLLWFVFFFVSLCNLYNNLDCWRCFENMTKKEKFGTFYNKFEDEPYKSKHVVLGDHLLL